MTSGDTSEQHASTPLVRSLLPSLAVLVILPFCAAMALLWFQHQQRMRALITEDVTEIRKDLELILSLEATGLDSAMQPIAADAGVQKALNSADADGLLACWQPVFSAMHRDHRVTHMYFLDRDRTCRLRVHAPAQRGDRVDRFTVREAERTGKTAYGLELGPRGTFSLRVVRPVFADGKIIGFIELGKEIQEALGALRRHREMWNQMAVIINKGRLDQRAWEESQLLLGREADWDRMPHHVVVFSSQGHLPDAFAAWVAGADTSVPHQGDGEVRIGDRFWRIVGTPLRDAAGVRVGEMLVMRDITIDRKALVQELVLGGSAGLLLPTVVLAFVYRLLTKADRRIRAQQANLRNERWRLANIIEATRAGTWEWDVMTGSVVVSERWAQILGYTSQELAPMSRAAWEALYHPDDLESAKTLLERHFSNELPFFDHQCRLRHKDGRWIWIHCRGRISTRSIAGRPMLMCGTHSDITARKEGEAERERLTRLQQASELSELMQTNRLVALGTLMAGLAHEFNHPAQVVILNQRSLRDIVEACVDVAKDRPGNAIGLLTWNEVSALAPTLLEDMESATTYLQELIENVRSFASPNDEACAVIDRATLTSIAVASLRLVASYARRSQVALSSPLLGLATGPTTCCCRLQQVVVNLLINAIQASQPGDTVTLVMEQDDAGIRLIICDHGIGIDLRVVDQLGRSIVTTKADSGGSGLGLFISHHLVTGLGGTLTLAPRQPRGTQACVAFSQHTTRPAAQQIASPTTASEHPPRPS